MSGAISAVGATDSNAKTVLQNSEFPKRKAGKLDKEEHYGHF